MCIAFAVCAGACYYLLVVLWLLKGTLSRLLVVGLLGIAEALCRSMCLFGTIFVTLCLMVWDWRFSRAEPMLSCWHDLFFLFCLLLFYLLLPSMGWLCGVGVFGLIECSHSLPALHSRLQIIIIRQSFLGQFFEDVLRNINLVFLVTNISLSSTDELRCCQLSFLKFKKLLLLGENMYFILVSWKKYSYWKFIKLILDDNFSQLEWNIRQMYAF